MESIELYIMIVAPDDDVLTAIDKAFEEAGGHVVRNEPMGVMDNLPDIQNLIGYVLGAGGAASVLKNITNVAGVWIRARADRKVTIILGKDKLEVQGPNADAEVEKFLASRRPGSAP